jgi:hypothetical protein
MTKEEWANFIVFILSVLMIALVGLAILVMGSEPR